MLRGLDFHFASVKEVALVSAGSDDTDNSRELAGVVRSAYRPHLVLAGGPEGSERPELMAARTTLDGRAAAYVCERFACRAPVSDPAHLAAALDG